MCEFGNQEDATRNTGRYIELLTTVIIMQAYHKTRVNCLDSRPMYCSMFLLGVYLQMVHNTIGRYETSLLFSGKPG